MKAEKTAALYIRVSTDAQREEGYSIEAQTQMLKAYCISREIKRYSFYIDGGFSGSNIQRPEMQRMIEDINNGEISSVIVYKLDRLSRSQKDTLYLIEDVLNPRGVSFVSLRENMDTSTPIGRAMLGIMSAFAQLERETIKERTSLGMKERVKSGLWPGGGKIPFGYDYDKVRGILVPNEDAETVKKIYSLYLQGFSTLKIAQLTGLKYERLAIQILKRKTNIGYIVYNGVEYKGCHQPIISEDTFYAAQDEMKRRKKTSVQSAKCLLAGLLVCGICGSKMRYQKWNDGRYKIYCYSQDTSKTHLSKGTRCNNAKIWAHELEDAVLNDLFSLKYKENENVNPGEDLLKILSDTQKSIKRKISRLYELYANKEENEEDDILIEEINRQKQELIRVSQQIKDEKATRSLSATAKERLEKISALANVWENMTTEEKRTVLREVIDKIVITNDKIEIFYSSSIV